MGETKPLQLSCVSSIAYGDFGADFREVRASEGLLYIADWGRRPRDPNKPNAVKILFINNMAERSVKQTQLTYHTCYQLLAAILTASLRKFGWKGRGSLSRIRAHGQQKSHPNERLTPTAGSRRPKTGHFGAVGGRPMGAKRDQTQEG
jgi:hypothetical protein